MDQEHQVVVVVVPLPAQGHLNQLLHFSHLVSDRQIPVHYVGAATHNRQVKNRVHGWDPSATSNIHFHDFPIPSFPTPPPDTNASNKWPSHLLPMFEATAHLREPLAELLHSLSLTSRRVVVVHDNVMSFAAKEATLIPNGEAYSFNSCSAFGVMFFKWEALGRPSFPEGYEERVKGVGMIVRDWAPQLEILGHSSTGGFLTHCGWNSCMESLSMGVPMAAWPMHSDQPRNTMLITQILKVGVVAREWGNRNEVASPTEIEDAVRKLMASDDGKDMRKRAEELGVAIRESASKEGKSTAEFNSFIAHISRV